MTGLEGFYSGLGRAGRPGRTRDGSGRGLNPACFLGAHGVFERGRMPACDGLLRRCHLIPVRNVLKKEFGDVRGAELARDDRTWVLGCGGPIGNTGHHGMLDTARTLRLPRAALPPALEEFAEEHGLGWWLEREYGPARGEETA